MELLVKFTDESHSFTNGFEAGMIWEKLQLGQQFEMNIHSENIGLVKEMCKKSGHVFTIQEQKISPEWSWLVSFKKQSTDN